MWKTLTFPQNAELWAKFSTICRKRHAKEAAMTALTSTERSTACRARRLALMERNGRDPLHGTVTGYNYGCRCIRCRAAKHTAYVRYKGRKVELYEARRRIERRGKVARWA